MGGRRKLRFGKIPSGKNDGLGIAIKPNELPTHRFKEIIGVAWEMKLGEENTQHEVNISIGLNQNNLAPRVEQLENKVDNILAYLEGTEELKDFEDLSTPKLQKEATVASDNNKELYLDLIDKTIERGAPSIVKYYELLEKRMAQEGVNLRDYPVWENILNDPVTFVQQSQKEAVANDHWVFSNQINVSQGQ